MLIIFLYHMKTLIINNHQLVISQTFINNCQLRWRLTIVVILQIIIKKNHFFSPIKMPGQLLDNPYFLLLPKSESRYTYLKMAESPVKMKLPFHRESFTFSLVQRLYLRWSYCFPSWWWSVTVGIVSTFSFAFIQLLKNLL